MPEFTGGQWLGIGAGVTGLGFIAYALGAFDPVLKIIGKATTPSAPAGGASKDIFGNVKQGLTAGPNEVLCASLGDFRTYNQSRIIVTLPGGNPASGYPVYAACGDSASGGTPVKDSFSPIGTTDGNGVSPYHQCGLNRPVYLYASDPSGTYNDSGVVRSC